MISKKLMAIFIATILSSTLMLPACTTIDPITGEERVSNAGVGATIGAVGGAIVGSALGNTDGALIGAGVGALAGGALGHGMDRQEVLLRQAVGNTGTRVVRHGNNIRLIMPDDITFGIDKSSIRPHFYRTLNKVARILRDFPDTEIKIAGFTSNTGTRGHNQKLSLHRAQSVADYLAAQDIDPDRIIAVGYGIRYPIANNNTEHGRALNRRVEVTIRPYR